MNLTSYHLNLFKKLSTAEMTLKLEKRISACWLFWLLQISLKKKIHPKKNRHQTFTDNHCLGR